MYYINKYKHFLRRCPGNRVPPTTHLVFSLKSIFVFIFYGYDEEMCSGVCLNKVQTYLWLKNFKCFRFHVWSILIFNYLKILNKVHRCFSANECGDKLFKTILWQKFCFFLNYFYMSSCKYSYIMVLDNILLCF